MRKPLFLTVMPTLLLAALCANFAAAATADKAGTFYGAMPTEYPNWFKESFLDFRDDVAEAAAAGKRLMVIFHQDNCPYCNALVERNLSQKDIEEAMRRHFDVVALNMWGDREIMNVGGKRYTEKSFAAEMKVQFTPTILFFDEQAEVILRLNGYLPPGRFKVALDYVAQKKEKDISYHDYLAASAPPATSGALHPQDFFRAGPHELTRTRGAGARPLAVFFEQKDCPNCDVLHTRVLPDEATRDIIRQFDAVQLDMWSRAPLVTPAGKQSTARDWARELDVKYAPTIVLFNEDGTEVIRSEAAFKVFHTQGLLHYVLSGSYKTEPSFQRYLSARAEHFIEGGKDVDIWRYADETPGKH